MRSRRGFTLIELLIVICILGILMGMIFPIISTVMRKQAEGKARALVEVCKNACEAYRGDVNVYPWTKPVDVKRHMQAARPDLVEIRTRDVYLELAGRGSRKTGVNYLNGVPPAMIRDLGGGETLVDPWGREIIFRVDPKTMRPLVWSLGENGRDETNDGATGDPVAMPKIYYLYGQKGPSDDIPSPR
jgi:prepilin-type N-terminal cleavage/methylation domain-containing protein